MTRSSSDPPERSGSGGRAPRPGAGSRLALALAVLGGSVWAQEVSPRRPLDPGPPRLAPIPAGLAGVVRHQLVVKFTDRTQARATAAGRLVSSVGVDLAAAQQLADEVGARFQPLIRLPAGKLAALETRAAERSGRAQPDLGGMLVLSGLASEGPLLERVGSAFDALPFVEFAHIQNLGVPPPTDISPPTRDLTLHQLYFGAATGIDADWAHAQGYRGAGVRLSDCEYGWNEDHEDLNDIDIHIEPGQTIAQDVFLNGWDSHGTAVLGEMSAVDNSYGVVGLCPDAPVYSYPEWSEEEGLRRVTCVTNAIADSAPGDVVLLEMQDFGAGGGFAPAEVDPALFAVVLLGTDADVIVVAAAGNGGQDLDSAAYVPYLSQGDSGAIIVGAGSSDGQHDALPFSTFGARVDLQGWGEDVFTLGYGDGGLFEYGGDKNQRYTAVFGGTSAAAPFVAAACVLVQQAAEEITGQRLAPAEMRQLLVDTGAPQGEGGHVGPLPDLEAAIGALEPPPTGTWSDLGGGTLGSFGVPQLVMSGPQSPLSPLSISLTGLVPDTLMLMWISVASASFDALGGTVYAFPPDGQVVLSADASGAFSAQTSWPTGIPSGFSIWWQFVCLDGSSVWGLTLSNALQSTTP